MKGAALLCVATACAAQTAATGSISGVVRDAATGAPVGVVPDGTHGLWIPTTAPPGGQVRMVHYRDGHLRDAQMPVGARRLGLLGIATPGQAKTSFAVGSIFKRSMPSVDQAPEVYEFRR